MRQCATERLSDGEANQILSPVHGRFTDGYETTDLHSAREMLDTMPT
jgi:hypothetical protein